MTVGDSSMFATGESITRGVLYASRRQYLVGPPKTASGRRRPRRRPCPAHILQPPDEFMTRDQVRQKNFVNGMTLKIKPSLEWNAQNAAAEAEKKRVSEERRREKQLRRSNDVNTKHTHVKIDLPDDDGMRMEPAMIYDDHRMTAREIEEAWENVTQAGVTFWLNSATGEAQFENPHTGVLEGSEAEEVDEELEIVKILGGADEGAAADEPLNSDAFLQQWVNEHEHKLPV